MSARFNASVSVAGVGLRQYRRAKAPWLERGVLVRAIVDACEDAGFDPADVDCFVAYGDDKNEPVRLMSELGTKELCWSSDRKSTSLNSRHTCASRIPSFACK